MPPPDLIRGGVRSVEVGAPGVWEKSEALFLPAASLLSNSKPKATNKLMCLVHNLLTLEYDGQNPLDLSTTGGRLGGIARNR